MIIRAPRPSNNFYLLDKHISEDSRLSWAGRGLLVYLLGKPDGWQVQVEHLIRQTSASKKQTRRDGVYALLEELREAGYVERLQNREGGKFKGFDYLVHETPKIQSDEPQQDQPETAKPFPADPPQVSIDGKSISKKTTNHQPPSPESLDLARQLLVATLEGGGFVKNPRGWVLAVASRLDAQGGLAVEDTAVLAAAKNKKQQFPQQCAVSSVPEVLSATWKNAKTILSGKLSEADHLLWIEPLCCVMDDEAGKKLVLAGPDPYVSFWVKNNYMDHIAAALPGRSVQVI
jgi:hypothetical protein